MSKYCAVQLRVPVRVTVLSKLHRSRCCSNPGAVRSPCLRLFVLSPLPARWRLRPLRHSLCSSVQVHLRTLLCRFHPASEVQVRAQALRPTNHRDHQLGAWALRRQCSALQPDLRQNVNQTALRLVCVIFQPSIIVLCGP